MTIQVLLFASLAEQIQVRRLKIELSDNATVEEALQELCNRWPKFCELQDELGLAVNHNYVSRSHVLNAGDELALIPPVSGG